jgi:PEP-CTERM motif
VLKQRRRKFMNHKHKLFGLIKAGLSLLTLTLFSLFVGNLTEAKADPVNLGVASQFAVLYIGSNNGNSVQMSNPQGTVGGNIGLLRGNLDTSGPTIKGNVLFNGSGSVSHPGFVNGTIIHNSALVAQANLDARNAAAIAAGLAATNATTKVKGNGKFTLTGGAGVNVVNLTDLVLSGGGLTLIAPVGGSWVVNITGKFTLSGGADVTIGGGLTANDVLINVIGAGPDVHTSGGGNGAVIFGTVLAVNRNIALAPGLVNGRLIGGGNTISIVSGAMVVVPEIAEPATMFLLGTGLVGVAQAVRKKRRSLGKRESGMKT